MFFQEDYGAIFLQPTFWCNLKCKGCYVRTHHRDTTFQQTSWEEQLKLFDILYNNKGPVFCNQITVSIDDLPADQLKRNHLLQLTNGILNLLEKDGQHPQVHFTCRSPNTMYSYQNTESSFAGWKWLNLISFSSMTINNFDKTIVSFLRDFGVCVNLNHQFISVDKSLAYLTKVGSLVDQIYLLISKEPISMSSRENIFLSNQVLDINTQINDLLDKLPKDIKDKIHLDSCITAARSHRETGYTCNAGISKFQVWPDGSVSGCPYKMVSDTTEGQSADQIIKNIIKVKNNNNDFDECYIGNSL
jgi:hypothetical protein